MPKTHDDLMKAIYLLDVNAVHECLNEPTLDPNMPVKGNTWRYDSTPLLTAIDVELREKMDAERRNQIVLLLIADPRIRLDIYQKNDWGAIHIALARDTSNTMLLALLHMAKQQKELGNNFDLDDFLNHTCMRSKDDISLPETPLYIAGCRGNKEAIQFLLKSGANINNTSSHDGETALQGIINTRAERRSWLENQISEYRCELLTIRQEPLSDSIEKKLADYRDKLNIEANPFLESLLVAFILLLENGAQIEKAVFRNRDDATLLEVAVALKDIEVISALLERGANPIPAQKLLQNELKYAYKVASEEITDTNRYKILRAKKEICIYEKMLSLIANRDSNKLTYNKELSLFGNTAKKESYDKIDACVVNNFIVYKNQ